MQVKSPRYGYPRGWRLRSDVSNEILDLTGKCLKPLACLWITLFCEIFFKNMEKGGGNNVWMYIWKEIWTRGPVMNPPDRRQAREALSDAMYMKVGWVGSDTMYLKLGWVGYYVPEGGLGRMLCTWRWVESNAMYLQVGWVGYYVPGHRKVSPLKSSNFHG